MHFTLYSKQRITAWHHKSTDDQNFKLSLTLCLGLFNWCSTPYSRVFTFQHYGGETGFEGNIGQSTSLQEDLPMNCRTGNQPEQKLNTHGRNGWDAFGKAVSTPSTPWQSSPLSGKLCHWTTGKKLSYKTRKWPNCSLYLQLGNKQEAHLNLSPSYVTVINTVPMLLANEMYWKFCVTIYIRNLCNGLKNAKDEIFACFPYRDILANIKSLEII